MKNYTPTWDLQTLYQGYDDLRLLSDIADTEKRFSELKARILSLSSEDFLELQTFLEDYNRAAISFSTPETYVLLRGKIESASTEGETVRAKIEQIKQMRQDIYVRFSKYLMGIDDIEYFLDTCPSLAPYRFFLEESKRLGAHRPNPEIQAVLRNMQATGGYSWLNLHCTLDSSASVTLCCGKDERQITLSEARGLASASDAKLRKCAYLAELSTYPEYEVPMAACLNGIKGEALAELPYKHYDSVWNEMLDVNKIKAESLTSMLASIEDHLVRLRGYLKAKARYLGYKDGLPWYELLAPIGTSQTSFSFSQAHDLLVEALSCFSGEMAAFVDHAFENRWIDALPARGRQSGGICIDLPELKECRILVNYNGSMKDIRTIAHELGHAYHFRCLDHLPLCLRDAPTPICETASIMNETIFHQKCIDTSANEAKLYLADANLSEEIQTIMDIYSRYLFEQQVFRLRKERDLLPQDYCRLMTDAQKYVYGDALDFRYLHPYMWMNKVHYYIPEYHYYNYPYIFGLLFSKGLYSHYQKEPSEFPSRYKQLLSYTCSGNMEEIAAKAGIDISTQSFWNESLDIVCDEIAHFSNLII